MFSRHITEDMGLEYNNINSQACISLNIVVFPSHTNIIRWNQYPDQTIIIDVLLL